MGGGGGFVSAITDPISDVLGTSGGDGGLVKKGGWFQTLCEEHRGEWVPVEN